MMNKNGGKYIYEGSYGCAFYPALPCAQTGTRKGLGKLFNNKNDFKVEEKIQKFISKIDPSHEATILYYGSCRVHLEDTNKSDEINKCNITNEYSVTKRSINQLMFKFGGDDLDKIVSSIKHNSKYANFYFDTFITTLLPVAKCILKIAYYGYLHSDIKPSNILYSSKNNRMYLIDFGLLQTQQYLTQSGSALSFKYLYYPPEFTIMHSLRLGIKDPLKLYNSILENFEFYDYEKYMNYLEFAKYKTKLHAFIKYALHTPLEKLEEEFLSNYIKKLDVYSLGMTLVEIVYNMQIEFTFKLQNNALFNDFVQYLVVNMIHPDPRYRLSADEFYIRIHGLYDMYKIKIETKDVVKFLNIKELKRMSEKMQLAASSNKEVLYTNILKQPELIKLL